MKFICAKVNLAPRIPRNLKASMQWRLIVIAQKRMTIRETQNLSAVSITHISLSRCLEVDWFAIYGSSPSKTMISNPWSCAASQLSVQTRNPFRLQISWPASRTKASSNNVIWRIINFLRLGFLMECSQDASDDVYFIDRSMAEWA
jgi:hypothetical protein